MALLKLYLSLLRKQIHDIKLQKSDTWTEDNTFIFLVLGDRANIQQTSGFKHDIKYINYCLLSDAVLIKRLATKHLKINPNNIAIFAHGEENDFDIKSLSSEILIQLTINEIYRTTPDQDDFNFIYYKETNWIREFIFNKLKGHPDAHIILFLDNHGSPYHFADSPFFDFYLFSLNIDHSSLCILNDSCYSGSIFDILDNYFTISEVLKESNEQFLTADLHFISFIAKELQPDKSIKDLNYIFKTIQNCSQYEKNNTFLMDIITTTFQKLESRIKESDNIKLANLFVSNDVNDQFISDNIAYLSKIGINTFNDLSDLYKVIFYFNSIYSSQKNFKLINMKINSVIKPAKIIQNAMKCNNKKLFQIINSLTKQNQNFTENLQPKHPNHYIITSSHKKGLSPTFGTRRISDNKKLIPGSPAMGAFIIETLMFPNQNGIDIKRIKNIASETDKLYKEYAIQTFLGKKAWIRLFFTDWKSSSQANKNFFDLEQAQTTIESIMESVGFKLAARFADNDVETPINLDFNKEDGEKTPEKFGFIIQPRKKREKRRRYRTISKNNKQSNDQLYTEEKDLYYSDSESESESKEHKQSNAKSSSFVLATINCDERIDIKELQNFRECIYTQHIDFVPDLIFVFRYELKELTKNTQYPFDPNSKFDINNFDETMNTDILNWISHFISPWNIRFMLYEVLSQIGTYIDFYKIPTEKIKDLFKRSFNVADQVVTPIYFKRETFKNDRLSNCLRTLC